MAKRWIRRLGTPGSGFRYVDADGRPVRERATLARIERLRVPPAWRDVHVAAHVGRAVQAWGFDARGRKQYRYHARAVERRELRKYHRVRRLAKELPTIRRRLRADSARRPLDREAVAATVLTLIGETFCRVGAERYVEENGTFGITTVRKAHVTIEGGRAVFTYRGKSKVPQRQIVVDPRIVRVVKRLKRAPGTRLFRYRAGKHWSDLKATDVNRYLRDRIGGSFSAKDFRTWGGTLRAAVVLSDIGPAASTTEAKRNVALAMRLVASELGNTPTVCRGSYVHPMVIARYLDEGETIRPRRTAGDASTDDHSAEERALIAFLDRHFPERRRRPRPEG